MTAPVFDYIAGTGGVGEGILFLLDRDRTLGRTESRLGYLTDFRDYCKLHIILHYMAVFLRGKVPVYAISRVGADPAGERLLEQMGTAGVDTAHMGRDPGHRTMYTVCFQYPSGDGGNLTTSNSACSQVGPEDIDAFFRWGLPHGRGLLLAAPEVPPEARLHLLRQGRSRGCFNVAALLSAEAAYFYRQGAFALTDLLAVNRDEAEAIAALHPGGGTIHDRCAALLASCNPDIRLVITEGGEGARVYHRGWQGKFPAYPVEVNSTAGAGDCFLGTLLAALVLGVPLYGGGVSACTLAALASSRKVSCPHTIDFDLDGHRLLQFAREQQVPIPDEIRRRFFEGGQTEDGR